MLISIWDTAAAMDGVITHGITVRGIIHGTVPGIVLIIGATAAGAAIMADGTLRGIMTGIGPHTAGVTAATTAVIMEVIMEAGEVIITRIITGHPIETSMDARLLRVRATVMQRAQGLPVRVQLPHREAFRRLITEVHQHEAVIMTTQGAVHH